jgi:predicted membrane protein
MSEPLAKPRRNPSWKRTLFITLLISLGSVAILLPAWLPNRPRRADRARHGGIPSGLLLAGAAAVMFGASSHAGHYRPVCRVLGMGLIAAFVGEIEDFVSEILGWKFPEAWVVGLILLVALITMLRHRRVMVHFLATLGNHAGSGLIGSALLIIYVFNRVIGSQKFWKAALGPSSRRPFQESARATSNCSPVT